jgi:hypothetical protein
MKLMPKFHMTDISFFFKNLKNTKSWCRALVIQFSNPLEVGLFVFSGKERCLHSDGSVVRFVAHF